MSDIDKWLNEGVAEKLAKARAATNGQPPAPLTPAPSSPSPPASSPSKPPSLSNRGIGRGGVIRNKTTKIRMQRENPVTNPRPSPNQRSPGAKSVPESDPQAEFKAANPALAAPSLFVGMDIDINKKMPAPAPVQERIFSSAAPPLAASSADAVASDDTVRFDSTVRQLIEIAQRQPNKMVHCTTSRFVLSLELFKNPASGSLESPGAAPESQ